MNQEAVVLNTPYAESTPTNENNQDNASGALPDGQTIRDCISHALGSYFSHLDGQDVFDVYQMVMTEVEAPLLEAVMAYTNKNQTKASRILGLNRGTLRKKLKQYDMLNANTNN